MNRILTIVAVNRRAHLSVAAVLAAIAMLLLASCRKDGTTSKPPDVDYYTCAMHPSVRSQDPHGKCPICSMDLVPVKKKAAAATGAPASASISNSATMAQAHLTIEKTNAAPPSEFTVPVERQQQIGVTYATVEMRPLHRAIRAVGTVAYDKARHWDYVARVEGYVQKLNVFSRGESVEEGAPLLTIYSPELLTAQKEFVSVLKTRDDAQASGRGDVLKSAEELVKSGRERLRLWNLTEEQIIALEKTRKPEETLTLLSPFQGVVQDLGVDQGRRVATGDHLVDVVDLSVVWVWAQFYENEWPLIKKGLRATISTPAYPGEKFDGTISVVDPFINEALRTGRVRLDVPNPHFQLRPDMYVDVDLVMDAGSSLSVPVSAILPTGLHDIAFVDKGEGRLEPRFVELGGKYGGFYEVKSGLKDGEQVVASANFLIDAEAQVQGALKTW